MKLKKLFSAFMSMIIAISLSSCNQNTPTITEPSANNNEYNSQTNNTSNDTNNNTSNENKVYSNPTSVFSINGMLYYFTGSDVLRLEDENKVTFVPVPEYFKGSYVGEGATMGFVGDNRAFCIGDNKIYENWIYDIRSYDVNDVSNVKRKTIINEESFRALLKQSSRVKNNDDFDFPPGMTHAHYYNNRIYCCLTPLYDDKLSNYPDLYYKLVSFNNDGSDFKIYDNINCTDYCIKDGWIYYYDNGYYYDPNQSFDYKSFNKQNAGLYKARTDGTEIQLITKNFQHTQRYNDSCSNLRIFGDYLYFIVNTHNVNNRLCRTRLDGSGTIQEISRNKAYHYDIVDENTIYYDNQGKLYKISLNNQREDFITELYDS